jgi:hypothetical protein
MHTTERRRWGLVGGLATVAMLALMIPPAAADVIVIGIAPGTGTHRVAAACEAVAGVTTDLNEITFAVHGSADSFTTDGHAVGVGTGVRCQIRNRNTGTIYGTVSGGLPGPHAEAVGTITAPLNAPLKMCTFGNATFSDSHPGSSSNC